MKIAILGAGLAGCTLTYLLKQEGYKIVLIEKEDSIGGMCKTYYVDGLKREYGPHILYSDNRKVIEFIKKNIKVKQITVYVGTMIQNQIMDYPVSISNILKLRESEQIINELYYSNQNNPDRSNFENYVISLMGKTLYNLFIYGYTKKFWGIDPKELSATWAPKRISFRTHDKRLFKDSWQAYPDPDYNEFFKNLVGDSQIIKKNIYNYQVGTFGEDMCISTIPIDQLRGYKFGRLPYRGYTLQIEVIEREHYWPNNYAWVNFPNDYEYTRICEYKHYNLQKSGRTIISKEIPGNTPSHYPINTPKNEILFNKYLEEVCKFDNLITMGRLGLYSYIPMSDCIYMSMELVDRIANYKNLNFEKRLKIHRYIRGLY